MTGKWITRRTDEACVVFIHGFLSNAGAWRHEGGTYWPQLLSEDPVAKRIGVYVFEYQTGFFSGTYRLGNVVDELHKDLRLDKVLGCKRLVFFCHSMGGIVARRFIVRYKTELTAKSKSIEIGLFLIASPSLGSHYATWLRPLARLLKHSQADVLRFTEANDWLMDLDQEFYDLKEQRDLKIDGKELIEDKFIAQWLPWLKPVVPEFSAHRYFGKPHKVIGSTHFTIATVAGSNCDQHRLLVEFLTKIAPPKSGFSAVLSIDSYTVRCPLSLAEYDETASLTKNAFPEEVLIDLDSDRLAFLRNPYSLVGVFDNTGKLRGFVDIYHLTESDLEEFLDDTTGEARIDPERLLPYELARGVHRAYVATVLVPGPTSGRPLAALLYGFMLFLTTHQFHNTEKLELFSIGHSQQGVDVLYDHLDFKFLRNVPMPDGEPKGLFSKRFSKPELEEFMATCRKKWKVFSYSTFEIGQFPLHEVSE